MRVPARAKAAPRARVSNSLSYPAPIGGWNERDALAAMQPTDAIVLENWFPRTSYLEVRGGSSDHLTGVTGTVTTLAVYNTPSGTNKMFAVTNSGVYDASSSGAAGAAVAVRTEGKHQWLNYGDGTNNYLMMFNGVDKPLYYDNSSWIAVDSASSPALTGLTTTSIISAFASKERLYFIEKASLSFWYLPAGAAGGALTEFPLDGYAKRGGYLMAGATWTFDSGEGPDDAVAFVTSEGEVIVYKGHNPNSGTTWALVGVYDIGKPIGRRCLIRYGADLVVITQNGAFPLSKALAAKEEDRSRTALTNKIENAFNVAARSYGSVFGWEAINFPAQSAILFNVPHVAGGTHEQFVMNTITKAWCKFTDWDAECFAEFNGELYFGKSETVVQAWTGYADGSDDIVAYGKTAFSNLGSPNTEKQIKMFRPTLAVNGTLTFLTDIDVDFTDTTINGTATYTPTVGAVWDTDSWDECYWAAGLQVIKKWTSPSGNIGRRVAGKIKVTTGSLQIQWMSNDFIFETGGPL